MNYIFVAVLSGLITAFFIFKNRIIEKRPEELNKEVMKDEDVKKQERTRQEYLNFLLYDGEEQDDIM